MSFVKISNLIEFSCCLFKERKKNPVDLNFKTMGLLAKCALNIRFAVHFGSPSNSVSIDVVHIGVVHMRNDCHRHHNHNDRMLVRYSVVQHEL